MGMGLEVSGPVDDLKGRSGMGEGFIRCDQGGVQEECMSGQQHIQSSEADAAGGETGAELAVRGRYVMIPRQDLDDAEEILNRVPVSYGALLLF